MDELNIPQFQQSDKIEVNKTSTGKYSFTVRIGSKGLMEKDEPARIVERMKEIYEQLESNFKNA